ncbi:MAG: hypothetical protein ACOCVA_06465, partial [Prolixibacteraceae bacterium]
TSTGYGHYEYNSDTKSYDYYKKLLNWTGRDQHVKCSDYRLVARIHQGTRYHVLWIVNSTRETIKATLTLSKKWSNYSEFTTITHVGNINISGADISAEIPKRETMIIKFIG